MQYLDLSPEQCKILEATLQALCTNIGIASLSSPSFKNALTRTKLGTASQITVHTALAWGILQSLAQIKSEAIDHQTNILFHKTGYPMCAMALKVHTILLSGFNKENAHTRKVWHALQKANPNARHLNLIVHSTLNAASQLWPSQCTLQEIEGTYQLIINQPQTTPRKPVAPLQRKRHPAPTT